MDKKIECLVNFVKPMLLFILVLAIPFSYAHETEEIHEESIFQLFNTMTVIALSIVGISACTIMLLNHKDSISGMDKKIIFVAIAVIAIASTGYLIGNTIYMTLTSWSKGLIHWHADFEIWICGEKVVLPDAEGLANRVGTAEVHHHGDYRIHLEGIIENKEDATMGRFFETIKVPFSDKMIMNMENGAYCPDGKQGMVKMLVNGGLYTGDYRDYIIAPYSQVPPGDVIKIVFE